MRAWSRVEPERYGQLPLRAHALLADVPLHDVWRVELPGGGPGRAVADVRAFLGFGSLRSVGTVVRALFALRGWLGRVFGWDAPARRPGAGSYLGRLSQDDRARSQVEPGSPDGPFTVLYVHPKEAVSEIRNATVHAFSVLALEARSEGYTLFWAIHVAPVGRATALYMALIDPFRRFLVYPAVLRHVHRSWCAAHEGPDASSRRR